MAACLTMLPLPGPEGQARSAAWMIRHRHLLEHAATATALPELPPEDCGGILAFNEFPAALDDTFDADEMTTRLAEQAKVLIPAS